tara:strand:- start:578 stop:964 length:387 start_codon:yes stop_codon:yes gene_type:complete
MPSAGDKRILYKSHCVPQEQVGSGNKYYLDSDCGRKLTGSNLYSLGSNTTATGTLTSTGELGADSGFDFIAVTATSISSGTVYLSLDNGTTQVIELLEGECFASKIASAAQPVVTISGTATVDYMTGT